MFESALRYFIRHPARAAAAILSEPLESWARFEEAIARRREHPPRPDLLQINQDWERRLHQWLGMTWPCKASVEFWRLWPEVIGELTVKGIPVGPDSFLGSNDGDAGLVRAIWCLTRHLRPRNVVETGVAHGVTSRFILEALERNGVGHLWSVDRQPLDPSYRDEIGIAVGGRYPARWSYVKGTSRRRLSGIFSKLDQLDLFIHDSLHSEHNVLFEMERAWPILRPGGAVVVDDIDTNAGFRSFMPAHADHEYLVCEAEPVRPDLRRFNNKGLFGIVLKRPRN